MYEAELAASRLSNSGKTWFSLLIAVWAVARRRVERNAAQQQRAQRLQLHGRSTGAQLQGESGGIPEPGLVVHITVVGRPDESVDRHALHHVADVPAEHRAHLEIAEEDRRAERNRAHMVGLQQERMSRDIGLQNRRILVPDERPLRLARGLAREHGDVRSGGQRARVPGGCRQTTAA